MCGTRCLGSQTAKGTIRSFLKDRDYSDLSLEVFRPWGHLVTINILSGEWKIRLEQLVSRLVGAESEVSVQSSVAFSN